MEGVESHRGVHQLVNMASKALLDFCQNNSLSVDTSHIIDEVQDVNARYDKLCRANFDMEKQSRVAEQSVGLYQKALQPVQQTIVEVNSYLESEPAIGLDAEKGKEELVKVEVRGIVFQLVLCLTLFYCEVRLGNDYGFKTEREPSCSLS